ncbi:hypothetical protein GYH30_051915 [Glycine max]|nr:hypothetical protein GYH30_051915 [Glycine max]
MVNLDGGCFIDGSDLPRCRCLGSENAIRSGTHAPPSDSPGMRTARSRTTPARRVSARSHRDCRSFPSRKSHAGEPQQWRFVGTECQCLYQHWPLEPLHEVEVDDMDAIVAVEGL